MPAASQARADVAPMHTLSVLRAASGPTSATQALYTGGWGEPCVGVAVVVLQATFDTGGGAVRSRAGRLNVSRAGVGGVDASAGAWAHGLAAT
jgi:hypothetical protein